MALSRRHFLGVAFATLAVRPALAQEGSPSAAAFSFEGLAGGRISLGAYLGRPILVVNTASRCGYAGQLGDMAELWELHYERGLMIVAVPSNDFGQEPGDPAAIRRSGDNYGAKYPFTAIQRVVGAQAHPFYRWAALQKPSAVPAWNFHKYLVGADGRLVGGYGPAVRPTSPQLVAAIEQELEAGGSTPLAR